MLDQRDDVAHAEHAARVAIGISGPGGDQQLPNSLLQGGSISGLIAFQTRDLTDARNLLGQLALAIGQQANDQQARGLDLLNQPGAAMFRFGAASGLPVLAGRASSANTGTGTVSMTLQSPATLDAAQVSSVQASDYELRADGLAGSHVMIYERAEGVTPVLCYATPGKPDKGQERKPPLLYTPSRDELDSALRQVDVLQQPSIDSISLCQPAVGAALAAGGRVAPGGAAPAGAAAMPMPEVVSEQDPVPTLVAQIVAAFVTGRDPGPHAARFDPKRFRT